MPVIMVLLCNRFIYMIAVLNYYELQFVRFLIVWKKKKKEIFVFSAAHVTSTYLINSGWKAGTL